MRACVGLLAVKVLNTSFMSFVCESCQDIMSYDNSSQTVYFSFLFFLPLKKYQRSIHSVETGADWWFFWLLGLKVQVAASSYYLEKKPNKLGRDQRCRWRHITIGRSDPSSDPFNAKCWPGAKLSGRRTHLGGRPAEQKQSPVSFQE